jgi:hypothetical protein
MNSAQMTRERDDPETSRSGNDKDPRKTRGMVGRQRTNGRGRRAHAGSLLVTRSARVVAPDGHRTRQPSGRTRLLHERWDLDARRGWIWRNGTLAGDVLVSGSRVFGEGRRLNRVTRFGGQSSGAGQRRQDSSSGTVRGLHDARRRSADRLVMHRAHGARAMAACAFLIMRVCRGDP